MRPILPLHLDFAWRAFFDLAGDRPLGFGAVGPIPFTAVDAYGARYGIEDRDQFERFFGLIRAMDEEYRKTVAKPAR